MEFLVLALLVRHERDARRVDRSRPKNRKLFFDDTKARIVLYQRLQEWLDLPANRTTVIEELDHRHIATRITTNWRIRIFDKVLFQRRDERPRLLGCAIILTFLGNPQRLNQDLRMCKDVV